MKAPARRHKLARPHEPGLTGICLLDASLMFVASRTTARVTFLWAPLFHVAP